jgi:hypothetical protein
MKMISAPEISLAVVLASGGGFYPSDAQAQPSIQIDPGGAGVEDERDRRGRRRMGMCEELREGVSTRNRLGEQGEGNCRRYPQPGVIPSRGSG